MALHSMRGVLLGLALAACGCAQPQKSAVEAREEAVEWVCPMDPDVRAKGPAKCRKCGMDLVAGIPEPKEYRVRLEVKPPVPKPAHPVDLTFRVFDPADETQVTRFDVVHEKLFHLFIVSRDLTYFAHEHPDPHPDGSFSFRATLPAAGEYRLLTDFYPTGATPQMIARTIIVAGVGRTAALTPDLAEKSGENLRVRLRTEPARPLAGQKTMLFFDLEPEDGLEPYLGAWGHMLAASADLIDMIHAHPAFEDSGPAVQFNVIFPRPGMHRVWVQFQRRGIVNTVAFNVPVSELK